MATAEPGPPRVALVTGGSRGIGAALATGLARAGHAVAVNYVRDQAAAADVVTAIEEHGGRALAVQGDVGLRVDAERIVREVVATLGPISCLVNNAGVHHGAPVVKLAPELWDESIRINLSGAFYVTQLCLPPMYEAEWGRIIFIGSAASQVPFPGDAAYAATKAGIEGMAGCLAREVGRAGITVNTVVPGWVETDMTRAIAPHVRERLLRSTPVITGSEVADLVCYLCSDAARSITGERIWVRGTS
jgi:3-oxoacyl-[acyl-carrier protein] reductase